MGNLAGWIKAERKRHGWKVEELSRRLIDAGYQAEVNTVRVWEAKSGRDPRADTIVGLERLFGSSAPVTQSPDRDSLVAAAIDRQTAVLERIAALLERGTSPDLARIAAALGEAEQSVSRTAQGGGVGRAVAAPEPEPQGTQPI